METARPMAMASASTSASTAPSTRMGSAASAASYAAAASADSAATTGAGATTAESKSTNLAGAAAGAGLELRGSWAVPLGSGVDVGQGGGDHVVVDQLLQRLADGQVVDAHGRGDVERAGQRVAGAKLIRKDVLTNNRRGLLVKVERAATVNFVLQ